jgi:hypothetical protein
VTHSPNLKNTPEYRHVVETVRVSWSSWLKRHKHLRPQHCSACGVECKPQGHHPDYSKPLEVVWLCRPCHRVADGLESRRKVT